MRNMRNRSRHHTRNTSISTSKQLESLRVAVLAAEQNSAGHDTKSEENNRFNTVSSDIQQRSARATSKDVDFDGHPTTQEAYYDNEESQHRSTDWDIINNNMANIPADSFNYYHHSPVVLDNTIGIIGSSVGHTNTCSTTAAVIDNGVPSDSVASFYRPHIAANQHPFQAAHDTPTNYYYGSGMVNSDVGQMYGCPFPTSPGYVELNQCSARSGRSNRYFPFNSHYTRHNSYSQNNSENWMPQRVPKNCTPPSHYFNHNNNLHNSHDRPIPIHCITSTDILNFESKLKSHESNGSFTPNTFFNMSFDNKVGHDSIVADSSIVTIGDSNQSYPSRKLATSMMVSHSNECDQQQKHHQQRQQQQLSPSSSLSTTTINNIIEQPLHSLSADVPSEVVIGSVSAAKDNRTNALINLSSEFAHTQDYNQQGGLLSSTILNLTSPVGMSEKSTSATPLNISFNQTGVPSAAAASSGGSGALSSSTTNVSIQSNVIPMLSSSSSSATNSSNIYNNCSMPGGIATELPMPQHISRDLFTANILDGCPADGEDALLRTNSDPVKQNPAAATTSANVNDGELLGPTTNAVGNASVGDSQQLSNSATNHRDLSPNRLIDDNNTNSGGLKKLISNPISSSNNNSPSKAANSTGSKDPKDYKNVESIVNKILVPLTYSSYSDIIDMDNQFYKLNLDNISENYYNHHHQQQTTNFYPANVISDYTSSPQKMSDLSTTYSKNNYSVASNNTTPNSASNSSTMGVTAGATAPNISVASGGSTPAGSIVNNSTPVGGGSSGLRAGIIGSNNNGGGSHVPSTYVGQPSSTSTAVNATSTAVNTNQYAGVQRKLKYTTNNNVGGVAPVSPISQHHHHLPLVNTPSTQLPHQMLHMQSSPSSAASAGLPQPSGMVILNQPQPQQPPTPQQSSPNATYITGPTGGLVNASSCYVVGAGDVKNNLPLQPQMLDKVVVNKLEAFRNNIASFSNLTLKDIQGWIVDFSRDQHGSRFIQQKMEKSVNGVDRDIVFKEIVSSDTILYTLMTDVFGNYVVQKMLEYGNDQQKRVISSHLKGRVLVLTTQMYGCRVIQKAIECIPKDLQTDLIHELDGHVLECVKDQNGNHVIQKCIEHVPANNLDFIINEFVGRVYELSSHPYGCRVIQRLMEHCAANQTQSLMLEIFENLPSLVKDQYGNYVIQHILDHKKHFDFPVRIIHYVFDNIFSLSAHKFASNVVEKCVQFSTMAQKEELIKFILRNSDGGCNDNLYMMMKDPFANYVVQKIVDSVSGDIRKQLLLRMKPYFINLKKLTYGKHMINKVDRWLKETETMTSFIKCEEEFPSLNSTRPSG